MNVMLFSPRMAYESWNMLARRVSGTGFAACAEGWATAAVGLTGLAIHVAAAVRRASAPVVEPIPIAHMVFFWLATP